MRRRRARLGGWPCRCWWRTASRAPEAAPRPACPAPSTAPSRRTRTTSSRTRCTSVSRCRTSTSRAPPTCAPPTCRCRVAPGSASPCPRTPSTWASSGVRRPTGLTTSPRRAISCSHVSGHRRYCRERVQDKLQQQPKSQSTISPQNFFYLRQRQF